MGDRQSKGSLDDYQGCVGIRGVWVEERDLGKGDRMTGEAVRG